mmetsp:Transcript_152609/g.266469  ORF Transcript_152609/g.266469 Transcript_152609/m.266469 type:complete len:84 (+) Transcript_152609:590-841(+)
MLCLAIPSGMPIPSPSPSPLGSGPQTFEVATSGSCGSLGILPKLERERETRERRLRLKSAGKAHISCVDPLPTVVGWDVGGKG